MTRPSNPERMETVRSSCPDPEALAAWLDQGVGAAEREHIEAHLAACDECRVLVAVVLETQNAVNDPPATAAHAEPAEQGAQARLAEASSGRRVVGSRRASVLLGVASVLTAAAMLAVGVQVGPTWWASWRAGGVDSKLADLAAAVGNERTVEARLTGGFRYGPLRAPVRSGGSSAAADNWTLFAAAGRIRGDAERDPTAANLHALGLAQLVLGDHDEAVRAFEDAIAEDPQNARYQCDLAAAYLARARHLDRPDDFPRALGAAERAVKTDDTLVEARFNRALALEALFLNDQARLAWEDYVARDPDSGWADEARRHLQALQQKGGAQPDLARNNSPPVITDTTVEAGLDWLLRQGLPAWAEAILANDPAGAAREQSRLTAYSQQLSAASSDSFPSWVAALTNGSEALLARRAAGVRGFTQGLALLDADDMAGAETTLSAACVRAEGALAFLCNFEIGRIDVLRRRDSEAQQRIDELGAIAEASASPYMQAKTGLLLAHRLAIAGEHAAALEPYQLAYDRFSNAKYLNLAGQAAIRLADLFESVGFPDRGWEWRHRALRLNAELRPPNLITQLSIAENLARSGELEAARVFINAFDQRDVERLSGPRRALLEVSRSRIALALHDFDTARESFIRAERIIATSQDFRTQGLKPEVLTLRSQIERDDAQLERARTTLTEAVEAMGPERAPRRVAALLSRASISAERPEWHAASERDVTDVIGLLRARAAAPAGQPLRLEDAVSAFAAAGSLISAEGSLQGPKGLYLVEQLRELLDGVPASRALSTNENFERALRAVKPGGAVVMFLFTDHSLLAWTITGSGVQFLERPIRPADVASLARTLTVQVNRTPHLEDRWRSTLSQIYDLVFRDLPVIESATELAIIADGPLNRVPPGALFDSRRGQYLFERAAVRVAPNLAFALSTTSAPEQGQTAWTAAVVGEPELLGAQARIFPRLPRAKTEAAAVSALYRKSSVMLGSDATKARVLDAIGTADVLHFAGHAVVSATTIAPRLMLAGDVSDPRNALSGGDLANRITKPLRVVLAACETGATTVDRAAGVGSISSAFLRAGAASVVATLWDLDDSSSEPFFREVHRSLVSGHTTATAVARAQRACRADEQCRGAPRTWIGTTVFGSQ